MKEEVNTFHMTPNTNIFINRIVDFESQSPYYPNAPRRSRKDKHAILALFVVAAD